MGIVTQYRVSNTRNSKTPHKIRRGNWWAWGYSILCSWIQAWPDHS